MRRMIVIAGALLLAPVAYADEQPPKIDIHQKHVNPQKSDLSVPDRKFVEKAASDDMEEIELSKLAMQKSSNEQVKSCARSLIDGNEKALRQLRTVANAHDFPIPTSPSTLTDSDYRKLSGMSGDRFDDHFVSLMNRRTEQAIDDFEKAKLDNSGLQRFVDDALPSLKQHKDELAHIKR